MWQNVVQLSTRERDPGRYREGGRSMPNADKILLKGWHAVVNAALTLHFILQLLGVLIYFYAMCWYYF